MKSGPRSWYGKIWPGIRPADQREVPPASGEGSKRRYGVGKSKKVVKRRGVGVLVFGVENCLEVDGGREDLDGSGLGAGVGPDSGGV